MPPIKLQSNDGKIVDIDSEAMECSRIISVLLATCDGSGAIPLPTIDGATLERVVRWAKHYRGNAKPAADAEADTVTVPEWDAEFLKISQDGLCKLIMASNFLDIRGLMHVTCLTIALQMKGKSIAEMRLKFGIVDDFPETEQLIVRLENEWCENK